MKPFTVMLIAGEASGDAHAAGLVAALRPQLSSWMGRRAVAARPDSHGARAGGQPPAVSASAAGSGMSSDSDLQPLRTPLVPRFFGAGGPRMAAAGVALELDLVSHAVFGLAEVVRELGKFRRFLRRLLDLACARQPDLIVLVDSAGFNRRFASAIRRWVARRRGPFHNWSPCIVYYISPQVWASREGRARQLARDVDLMLSIFPFERDWYTRRVPHLRVEFVGHPVVERCAVKRRHPKLGGAKRVLLLPGSRVQEVRRHLPLLLEAARLLRRNRPISVCMAVPDARLLELAKTIAPLGQAQDWPEPSAESDRKPVVAACVGPLPDLLSGADLALVKSGSVTLECACFRVPAVVIYRVAWPTWTIARMLVRVPHVAMPNLLAGKRIYPELLQSEATPEAIAREALRLLDSAETRAQMRQELDRAVESLGGPGAYRRAAEAIVRLLEETKP